MASIKQSEVAKRSDRSELSSTDVVVAELKTRCRAFGVDATTDELVYAGLLALANQTETALEANLLQSLRADRSFDPRKSGRK